jgi:hypothetical protein
MKNAIFCDVTQCGTCKSRRFGGTDRLRHQYYVYTVFLPSVRRLLVTAIVPSSSILVTLILEAIRSSETSVLKTATQHDTPEDGILHSHRRENIKSYIPLTGWTL